MKIACVDQEIRKALESNYYKIPRFQRPYSWDKENIEDFWNDINAHKSGEFFIGSMVVYIKGQYRYIVDGQQRLTTITILLAALRDKFTEIKSDSQARGLQKLIERANLDNVDEFVIQTSSSYPFFQQSIQSFEKPKKTRPPGDEEILLKEAYDQLRSLINSSNDNIQSDLKKKKHLESIRNKLLALKIIYVEVDNEDDAYIIFETLNTRGKDLTSADLLKNHIAKLLRQSNPKNDQISIDWKHIRDNIDKIDISDIKIDNFVYHHWLATREFTTEKEIYKRAKLSIPDKAAAKAFLSELKEASEIYMQIFTPGARRWKFEEVKLKRSLEALLAFRVRQPIPMILSVMQSYEANTISKKEAERALTAIELFHYSFTALTSQRSSGGISHMYALHARELMRAHTPLDRKRAITSLINKLKARLPKQADFNSGFSRLKYSDEYPKDKRIIQYTLRRLYENASPSVTIDSSLMTIEHIEPQSSKEVPAEKIAEIGNLWLLSAEENHKMGNKPIAEKIPLYRKSQIPCDPILDNAIIWNTQTISDRTTHFAKTMWTLVNGI